MGSNFLDLNYSQQDLARTIASPTHVDTSIEFTPIQNKVDSMEQMLQKLDEGTAIVPHENETVEPKEKVFNQDVNENVVPIDPTAIIENVDSNVNPNENELENAAKTKEEEFMDMFQ